MKWIVYCTTNKINGKIYVGVHKTEDPNIFDGYIGNGLKVGWKIKNPETAFECAINKYGYSNFSRSILYVFDNEDEAYNKEAEIVNFEFIQRHDNYNTSLGGKHSGCAYDKLYQYDLDGNFIKEWPSVSSAIEFYKCNKRRFIMAINDKRSAFESYWLKIKVDKLNINNYRKSRFSGIYQYDLNGNYLNTYKSTKEIADKYKISIHTINSGISKRIPVCGYYFTQRDNILDIVKLNFELNTQLNLTVSCYDMTTKKLIQSFLSSKYAAKELGLSYKLINNAINVPNKIYNNKLWSLGRNDNYKYTPYIISKNVGQYDKNGNLIHIFNSVNECLKKYPKAKFVLNGGRTHTHGFIFKYL